MARAKICSVRIRQEKAARLVVLPSRAAELLRIRRARNCVSQQHIEGRVTFFSFSFVLLFLLLLLFLLFSLRIHTYIYLPLALCLSLHVCIHKTTINHDYDDNRNEKNSVDAHELPRTAARPERMRQRAACVVTARARAETIAVTSTIVDCSCATFSQTSVVSPVSMIINFPTLRYVHDRGASRESARVACLRRGTAHAKVSRAAFAEQIPGRVEPSLRIIARDD